MKKKLRNSVMRRRQVRIMDMNREQLQALVDRREKSLRFARGLLASFDIGTFCDKENL